MHLEKTKIGSLLVGASITASALSFTTGCNDQSEAVNPPRPPGASASELKNTAEVIEDLNAKIRTMIIKIDKEVKADDAFDGNQLLQAHYQRLAINHGKIVFDYFQYQHEEKDQSNIITKASQVIKCLQDFSDLIEREENRGRESKANKEILRKLDQQLPVKELKQKTDPKPKKEDEPHKSKSLEGFASDPPQYA
jgi:hypothetical protein